MSEPILLSIAVAAGGLIGSALTLLSGVIRAAYSRGKQDQNYVTWDDLHSHCRVVETERKERHAELDRERIKNEQRQFAELSVRVQQVEVDLKQLTKLIAEVHAMTTLSARLHAEAANAGKRGIQDGCSNSHTDPN